MSNFVVMKTAIITFLTTFAAYVAFAFLSEVPEGGAVAAVLQAFADGVLMGCLSLLLKGPWRLVMIPLLVVIPLFLECQLLYFRCLRGFFSGSILLAGNIFDPLVIKNAVEAFRAIDLLLFIPWLSAIWMCIKWRTVISEPLPKRTRLTSLGIALLIFIAEFVRMCGYQIRNEGDSLYKVVRGAAYSYANTPFKTLHEEQGATIMMLYSAAEPFMHTQLNNNDLARIKARLKSDDSHPITANKGKNLIIILVESLNSFIMDVEGIEFPTLRTLAADSSSVYVRNVESMVGPGNSADGQLMLTTGLLPLENKPFVSQYADVSFPAIAKALPEYESTEIICEDGSLWNHRMTNVSYGYGSMHDRVAMETFDIDRLLFDRLPGLISTLREPYFAMVTTLGTHSPYSELEVTPLLPDSVLTNYDDISRNYLQAMATVDRSLGEFIQWLKDEGRLENTIVVVTGDHAIPAVNTTPAIEDTSVPLIIYNAGVDLKSVTRAQQTDLFPTLLDVMGVGDYILPQTGEPYRGLGQSILDPAPRRTVTEDDWALSRKILLGRFFSR